MMKKITLAVVLAMSSQAYAGFADFTPLSSSQVGFLPDAAPILLSSPNFTQTRIADRTGSGVVGSNWDMIDQDASGRYLFAPFETASGGVMRIDLQDTNYATRVTTIVAPGTQGFVAGDASRVTPWGSYLTAEESWGSATATTAASTKGRLFEVTNATTAGANGGNFVQRSVIPRVSHEGLAFDAAKNLYFIDELNGGSIYKYTSANPNASSGNDYFAAGQTFAAKVNGGGNANAVGSIVWEAITTATGGAISGVSTVLGDGTIDGRASANTVLATDYQRPEDMEIKNLANGNEVMFIATTTTNQVYMFDLTTNTSSVFADQNTIDLATGLAVGSGLTSPDNIAVDPEGNIYIVEDRNGGVDNDIWFAKDLNKDGDLLDAGEGLARWASNGTEGSEFTGLFFDKFKANTAYVNIQHPKSSNDSLIQMNAAAPVPEAESYAMLLAGLGVMGAVRRRNSKK